MIYTGIDDGYAETKIAWFSSEDKRLRTLSFPSRVASGAAVSEFNGGAAARLYTTSGNTYTALPPGAWMETRFDEFPISDINRVLVQHAMLSAGLSGKEVHLCTGLPPGAYFSTAGGVNDALIGRKKTSIAKPISNSGNIPSPHVAAHDVCPEAIAAAIDHMIDTDGNVIERVERMWAVVDIGGRTTDVVSIVGGSSLQIDRTGTGTADIGVLQACDLLKASLADQFELSAEELPDVSEALRTGIITLWGKPHDVSGQVEQVLSSVGEEVLRFVQRKIRGGAKYDKVLFVGGGSECFRSVLQRYPFAHIPHEPGFANARGMAKSVCYQ